MESLVLGRWPIASSKDWGGGVEPFVREGGVDAPPPFYFFHGPALDVTAV
jgi:hypothetical protein